MMARRPDQSVASSNSGAQSSATSSICGLIFLHSLWAISAAAVLIGLGLAPCFSATLSLLLQRRPRPRQAALALALTGLGGAALVWAMGAASSRMHSLKTALVLPLIGSLALLALCIRPSSLNAEGAVTQHPAN